MNRVTQYFQAVLGELKHVKWPTQMQTAVYALLVIAISAFVALFVSFFDLIFSRLLGIIGINF